MKGTRPDKTRTNDSHYGEQSDPGNEKEKNLDNQSAADSYLNRRTFLKVAGASAALLATGGLPAALAAKGGKGGGGGGGGGKQTTRNPLRVPPAVSANNYSITAASGTADLGGGNFSSLLTYNGFFPGPTFVASRGDSANIQLNNGLSEDTTIHWHGMVAPTDMDGQPQDPVAPGASYLYQYPIVQRACLNFYHPHAHHLTASQVNLGLAGGFIIRDAEEAALNLPAGIHELPLIIRDATLDSKGNLKYEARSSGFWGQIPLVNGTRDAALDVDTALYRFRVLNGSNARVYDLALSNGDPLIVIGNDGGLLPSSAEVGEIRLSPGERLDLLVDFRGLPLDTKVSLRDLFSGWDLVEFNVAQSVTDTSTIPTTLSSITPLSNPVTTRVFSFDGMSRINGQTFELDRIDFQVPFGQTEIWRFITNGNAPHPVHVHGASFQVVSRTGGRGQVFPWEQGWKDTVLLDDQEEVEVLIRFDHYRGRYLMHCHQLEHEDSGMMTNFEVV